MLIKLVPVITFAIIAVVIIQLVNLSFSKTYRTIESTVEKPYARALSEYDAAQLSGN